MLTGSLLPHGAFRGGRPVGGDVDLHQAGQGGIDRGEVHVHHVLALLSVGSDDLFLHVLVGILVGDDVGQFEEGSLHGGVGASAHN